MKRIIVFIVMIIGLQAFSQELDRPIVAVTGEGIVKVVPDEVTLSVSLEHTGKQAKEVKEKNDAAVDAVLKFLKKAGIPEKNIQTQYVRLNKNYDYNTKTYQYSANQSITILLKDLEKYESIMSGLMESGINRIDGITFGSSAMESLKAEARRKAVANAKTKAVEYANELGQKIGKAVYISEAGDAGGPQPVYKMASFAMESGQDQQETLALGEMSIKANISVNFELF